MEELKILDATLDLPPNGAISDDDDFQRGEILSSMSIMEARFALIKHVVDVYSKSSVDFLINSLTAEPWACHRYHDVIADLYPNDELPSALNRFSGHEVVSFWRGRRGRFECLSSTGVPWQTFCPRLVRIIAAFETRDFDSMLAMSVDEDPLVRSALSRNPNLSGPIFTVLADDDRDYIRVDLAMRSDTPGEILRRLAKDRCISVRRWVAGNSATAAEVLKLLASEQDRSLRKCLLANDCLPDSVLQQLSACGDTQVETLARERIASNDNKTS